MVPAASLSSVWSHLREFFTLREQERRSGLSAFDRTEIRAEIERAVDTMREADKSSATLVRAQLARQAVAQVIIAAAAQLILADSRCDDWPELEQAIAQLSSLPGWDKHRSALALLPSADALIDAEYRQLADLFAYVERLPELRSPRDFATTRWLRRAGLLLVCVAGSWLAFKAPNLARGKMVTSSSTCSEMPAANLGLSVLSRAVDGVRRENSFAICTDTEKRPWVTVDLGAPRSLSQIVVYPHSEGPWGKTDIPQQLRVSLDNEKFATIGERDEVYTPDFPWRLELHETRAQYVQLIGVGRARQRLVLNEIEVYGR